LKLLGGVAGTEGVGCGAGTVATAGIETMEVALATAATGLGGAMVTIFGED